MGVGAALLRISVDTADVTIVDDVRLATALSIPSYYTVQLESAPTNGNAVIVVTMLADDDTIECTPASIAFNASTWNLAQRVHVHSTFQSDGSIGATISHEIQCLVRDPRGEH